MLSLKDNHINSMKRRITQDCLTFLFRIEHWKCLTLTSNAYAQRRAKWNKCTQSNGIFLILSYCFHWMCMSLPERAIFAFRLFNHFLVTTLLVTLFASFMHWFLALLAYNREPISITLVATSFDERTNENKAQNEKLCCIISIYCYSKINKMMKEEENLDWFCVHC